MPLPRLHPAPGHEIIVGDVRAALKEISSGVVQMAVCSPPYFGLRSYGTEPQIWDGNPNCNHEWAETVVRGMTGGSDAVGLNGGAGYQNETMFKNRKFAFCQKCNAWCGELGSEPTPELFIQHLVEVFRGVRRILRDDSVCFINIGDSYAAERGGTSMPAETLAGGVSGYGDESSMRGRGDGYVPSRNASAIGLKHKDLMLMPWRLALALQSDGWYIRDIIVWHKPSPMPSSVKDRCTSSWEPIIMMAKSERYFADMESVKQPALESSHARYDYGFTTTDGKTGDPENDGAFACKATKQKDGQERFRDLSGANLRNVWKFSTDSEPESHFACFPLELPSRCIKIGSSEKGCCPKCRTPYERITESERVATRPGNDTKVGRVSDDEESPYNEHSGMVVGNRDPKRHCTVTTTVGWRAGCECNAGDPVPCLILDPFLGSGTSSKAARLLGRHSIGIELSKVYAETIAVAKIRDAFEQKRRPQKKKAAQVGQKSIFES